MVFENGAAIDAALAQAALAAQREALVLGRPLVVWQDGRIVQLPPELIPVKSAAVEPLPSD